MNRWLLNPGDGVISSQNLILAPHHMCTRCLIFLRRHVTESLTGLCDWQEERLRRGDDLRLQMAIEESKREKPKPEEVGFKDGRLM